jgi:hypothetical protein
MRVGTLEDLSWETSLPLLSGRMLRQWTGAMVATAVVMLVILGTVFAASGEWQALGPMSMMIGAVTGGLWLMGLLVMVVIFRGKYDVRYTVTSRGVRCETIDKAAKAANRAAVVVGVLAGRPQAVGSGLIGLSRESEEAEWSGGFRVEVDQARSCLVLRNSWRTLMWIQCTPENFSLVSSTVAAHMADHSTLTRAGGPSPVPRYLGRSALVIVATLPIMMAATEFDTGLLVPILILCFALATVWLVNLFGWVVLAGLLIQAVLLLARQFEVRQSFFRRGETYRAYEVLSGDDISLLAVAGLGAAVLAWISIRALRGRFLAALIEGGKDMGA